MSEIKRPPLLTRRHILQGGLGAAGAGLAATMLPTSVLRTLASTGPAGSGQLSDIDHVVILIQENRSFDHYFGTLSSVRGFDDPQALTLSTGRSVFYQPDAKNPDGFELPFHMPAATTSSPCVADISHAWTAQHAAWNNGAMDQWLPAHRAADGDTNGPLTMGYLTRDDLPFYYALADAFTVCDGYHCSVFGPTNPNRVMSMSGTIDAAGVMGGPCIDNSQSAGQLQWTSYPELLQAHGIDWYQYLEADCDTNNVLPLFTAFQDPTTDLYRRGNTIIPTPAGQPYGPALAAELKTDVLSGNLPQVSWILASSSDCEHPSATPAAGARFVGSIIDALTADPAVWAKTVLFYTFDENDGFFDHLLPPTAPPNTAGEYLSASYVAANPGTSFGIAGPVGLGFRVPMVIISPFTRGGYLCSDTFDHTSLLRFLETRFGVEVPYISDWRRSVTGDLTSAFNFAATPDPALPANLPNLAALQAQQAAADNECSALPAPAIPAAQAQPSQEPGTRPAPSGPGPASGVPETPWSGALALAGGVAALATIALQRRSAPANEPATGG